MGKPGVDPDLANLHLGMALARAGDKAGATAAFKSVGGRAGGHRQYLADLRAVARLSRAPGIEKRGAGDSPAPLFCGSSERAPAVPFRDG